MNKVQLSEHSSALKLSNEFPTSRSDDYPPRENVMDEHPSASAVHADRRARYLRHFVWMSTGLALIAAFSIDRYHGPSSCDPVTCVSSDSSPAMLWMLFAIVGAVLLVTVFSLRLVMSRSAILDLAGTLDSRSADDIDASLAECGPPAVVRLIRAINGRSERDAERVGEQLNAQVACVQAVREAIVRLGLHCERVREPQLVSMLDRELAQLNSLVEASAGGSRATRCAAEPMERIDVDGFLDSLVSDYQYGGHVVDLIGRVGRQMSTRPRSLRRVLINLIDSALQRGGTARLIARADSNNLVLAIFDVETPVDFANSDTAPSSRCRTRPADGSRCGPGLTLARRLATSINGDLRARIRIDGSFESALTLPITQR